MTRLTRLCRAMGVGIAVAAATLSMTQVANAKPAAPTVPKELVPTAGQVFLVGHAKGVQIYTCNGKDWGSSVPRADLVDDAGKLVVKHFVGPTWQSTADGSAVKGTKVASADSPAHGPAIPWLLLSTEQAPNFPPVTNGLLTGTKFIQRLETKGGTAPPSAACQGDAQSRSCWSAAV